MTLGPRISNRELKVIIKVSDCALIADASQIEN